MEKEEKKNSITIKILIGLVILLIAGLGITIAYFSSRSASDAKTIRTGNLTINYEEDEGSNINLPNLYPIRDNEMQDKATKIRFRAHNESNIDAYMNITIEEIEMEDALKNLEFKWALYETDSNYTNAKTKINNGNFRNLEGKTQLIGKNIRIDSGKKYYNLYIWIRETGLDQQELSNKSFSGKIVIKGNQKEGQKLLSQVIKENNPPTDEQPDFSKTATTDMGLIKDTDEDGETYYFRGAVEDNYVKIGDLKWASDDINGSTTYHKANSDMLWRIVRINGDGTIRLIADGSIGNSKFNSINNDKKYVGYTYDNKSANNPDGGTDSTIKTYLETWYNENMTTYDKYIANTRYCNDTAITSTSGSTTYYGARDRLYTNKAPTFECPNTTEDYGGEYDLKVGLITADEVAFAGGKTGSNNTSYYLYGKSFFFWTASPYYFSGGVTSVWMLDSSGRMDYNYVTGENTVRPAVNLRADLLYTSGKGTSSEPYIVK